MLSLALGLIFAVSRVFSDDRISLVCFKSLSEMNLVESRPFQIIYNIYNVGDLDIGDVELLDDELPADSFIKTKVRSYKWATIAAKQSVTATLTYIPKVTGYYNLTSATVTYNFVGQPQKRVAQSNHVGVVMIIPINEYMRSQSSHILGWIITAALVVPCFIIPYVKWRDVKFLLKTKKKSRVKSE